LSSSPWTGAHSVRKHGVVLHRHGHARRCAHAPATAGELRHAAVLYSVSVGRVCAAKELTLKTRSKVLAPVSYQQPFCSLAGLFLVLSLQIQSSNSVCGK
jgi:hypothetical protein